MSVTQGDLPLTVDGLGEWILPAFSAVPCVHPAPGQPDRAIFVSDSFATALFYPPQILSVGNEHYFVTETCVTKLQGQYSPSLSNVIKYVLC
jgi:hypothetical protein